MLKEYDVMGSSPIPAAMPDSLVGKARTKTKTCLVYIAGWRSQLSRQGHYLKIGRAELSPATIGLLIPLIISTARGLICKLNYHRLRIRIVILMP